MFSVVPKLDCPHVTAVNTANADKAMAGKKLSELGCCVECGHEIENWFCMSCCTLHCSRYVKGHGAFHFETTTHPIAFSLIDASFWCYECEAYISHSSFRPFLLNFNTICGSAEILKYVSECDETAEDVVAKKQKIASDPTQTLPSSSTAHNNCKQALFYLSSNELVFDLVSYLREPRSIFEKITSKPQIPSEVSSMINQFSSNGTLLRIYCEHTVVPLLESVKPEQVVRLFGSVDTFHCCNCDHNCDAEQNTILKTLNENKVPLCKCGGKIIPSVSFDQTNVLSQLINDIPLCDFLVLVGKPSSGIAMLLRERVQKSVKVIII